MLATQLRLVLTLIMTSAIGLPQLHQYVFKTSCLFKHKHNFAFFYPSHKSLFWIIQIWKRHVNTTSHNSFSFISFSINSFNLIPLAFLLFFMLGYLLILLLIYLVATSLFMYQLCLFLQIFPSFLDFLCFLSPSALFYYHQHHQIISIIIKSSPSSFLF
jgi:hypothetical protein